MNKISLFSFLFSLFLNLSLAQTSGSMQTFSIPDGLSNPNVQYVYQDRFGYIWVMTMDGLNRFDGTDFKIYRNDPDDPNSLPNNAVFGAVEDSSGYLWIGSHGMVIRYDYATGNFKAFGGSGLVSNPQYNRFIYLFTDSKGRIWGSNSSGTVHKLDRELNSFEWVADPDNESMSSTSDIWGITELENGKILIADYRRGIFQYNESSEKLEKFFIGEGFSPTHIITIKEDDDGLIWFLGTNKVIRYNPNFYSYEVLDQFQLQSQIHHITFYRISDEDYILVSGEYGIIRFNPKTMQILESRKTNPAPYYNMMDKYGIIWIGSTGGLIKYDPNSEPFKSTRLTLSQNQDNRNVIINYLNLDIDEKQYVWLLSSGTALSKYNLTNDSFENFVIPQQNLNRPQRLDRFVQDRQGNLILGSTNNNGLFKYNISSQKVTEFTPGNYFEDTQDFAIDQNNNLFVASTDGMLYYNLKNNKQFKLPTTTNRSYSSKTETAIKKALGSASEIAAIKEADETKTYNLDFQLEQATHVLIRCMGEGQIDAAGDQVYDYGSISRSNTEIIFDMKDFANTFHAGGGWKNRKQYEVLELPRGDYNLKYIMDVGHSYNNFNVPMPADSQLYGIQVYRITAASYSEIKNELDRDLKKRLALPLHVLRDIEISRKYSSSVYLPSITQGLFRYNIMDSSFTQYTFGEIVYNNKKNNLESCHEDKAGNLWISTAQGLVMLNPENGKWRVFSEKDGLPSNHLLKTTEDSNGDLWILSSGGLSKFNKSASSNQWNFVNYDTRDGLTGYTFNGDLVKTPDGEILFAVADALHRFKPGKSNQVQPDIAIDDLKISDVSVLSSESPLHLKKSLMETDIIDLSYDLNDLQLHFNVLHYSRPYKNRIFYKMEGFNTDWIETDLGTATFTNLDPGNYVFKVKGISADGIQNEKGASLKIEITPPWWRTTFAYIGYFVFVVAVIFGIDRIQRRRILARERASTAIREAELRAQLAESENERKTKELEEARALQLSMLPRELPQLPHLDIAVYMQTATEVGGDYYDFHVSMDGTLTVVIGDATGHGMRAGTMVTTVKSLFKTHAANPDILFSFQEITRCIKEMNFGKLSMCLTMLKIKGDKMQISTAGMPPSFIFRRDTRVIEEHLFKAMPLGTMEKFPYEIKDTTLKTGDTILLMSDGLPELENDNGAMYGYKKIRSGFEDIADQSPEEIISFLKNEGARWIDNADPDDDVTFVVIKVK